MNRHIEDRRLEKTVATGEPSDMRVIRAAGGLIWRHTPDGPRVAVIHRGRYGDWSLPKGKLQGSESWHEAALREVKEETGCDVRITGPAGAACYEVNGSAKLVLFWSMVSVGECRFQPSEEVDRLEWLRPDEALRRLNYLQERKLLARVAGAPGQASFRDRLVRLRRWVFGKSVSYQRLENVLTAYSASLERRKRRTVSEDETAWIDVAAGLLPEVERALEDEHMDGGWKILLEAARMEIPALGRGELNARAEALRYEAEEKLGSWRKNAVVNLLRPFEEDDGDLEKRRDRLALATWIRDEDSQNHTYKIGLLRRQLTILGTIILAVVLEIWWLVRSQALPLGETITRDPKITSSAEILSLVILFGTLGGASSAAISTARMRTKARIPEQLVHWRVTVIRPLLGAAAAILAYVLFLSSGAFQANVGTLLLFAFAAGFSERLVFRATGSVTRRLN